MDLSLSGFYSLFMFRQPMSDSGTSHVNKLPSEKIISEIRLKLTFQLKNAKRDPLNFKVLKIFSVSWLNLDFVVFSMLVKKTCEKYSQIRLKAFHLQC
jgi:hypothetical protein